MERVLPSPEVKDRIKGLAIGLAADCDAPEGDVEKIMRENLKGAGTLPFVAFVTHDGKWVGGFSGYKDTEEFVKVLEDAEKTPYLQATKAVRTKLAGIADRIAKAAEKDDWKTIVSGAREADKTTGRCPERDVIAGFMKKAQEWAAGQLEDAVKAAQAGGDLAPANAALADVKKQFLGEPEAADADTGLKALKRLATIVEAEGKGTASPSSREKAEKEFKETRWAAIFDPEAAAKGEKAPGEAGIEEGDG